MSMDTPATIAILGAGPMGLEAGLYARYLGYKVDLYEQDEVAANVQRWGHLQMFSPFAQLRSPLGLASLRAQDPDYQAPPADAHLTGTQWVSRYLHPLSRTDLLADHIVSGAAVQGIARSRGRKSQPNVDRAREEQGFHILLQHRDGRESIESADIVIDTTGVFDHPNWCGAGGLPARGERRLRSRIEYKVPDILGAERGAYEGRRVLVVGSGLSAATTVVSLAKVMEQAPQTSVTWVTDVDSEDPQAGPVPVAPFVSLPQQRQLAEAANQCVCAGNSRLLLRTGTSIEAFDFEAADKQFLVWFTADPEPRTFDRIVANVGYRPDAQLYEELQVRSHVRTGGPWGVGAQLDTTCQSARQENQQPRAEHLVTTEPHFYILGAKSYGRDSRFLMTAGFLQIRDLFSIIGGRTNLDLYATMAEG